MPGLQFEDPAGYFEFNGMRHVCRVSLYAWRLQMSTDLACLPNEAEQIGVHL